jgi:hypothetical protein
LGLLQQDNAAPAMQMPTTGQACVYSTTACRRLPPALCLGAQHAAILSLPLLLQALCFIDWCCWLARHWLVRGAAVQLLLCL